MKRSSLKWLLSFGIILVIIFVFIVLLPTFLSTGWGANALSSYLSSEGRTVTVQKIDLNWFGDQTFEKFHCETSEIKANVEKITVQESLFRLIFRKKYFSNTIVQSPTIEYTLSKEKHPEDQVVPIPMTGFFVVKNGSLTLISPEPHLPKVHLSSANIEIAPGKGTETPLSITLSGETNVGSQNGYAEIDLEVYSSSSGTETPLQIIRKLQNNPADFVASHKIYGNVSIKNCSSKFLYFIPHMSNLPDLLLGDFFSFEGEALLDYSNGKIRSSLSSPLTAVKLSATLNHGVIHFDKPFEALFEITPELSDRIFSGLSIKPISSNHPLRLWVTDQGAYFPINLPGAIQKIDIPEGYLHLGQMLFLNAENLADILSLIQLRIRPNDNVPIWFQSARFYMSQGKLHIYRTDCLLDHRYQIAFWGAIDFQEQVPFVDMYLGITKQALEGALGIRGLPEDFVLILPMNGPLHDVNIHKSKALKKLGFLIGKDHLPIPGIVPPDIFKEDIKVPPPRLPFPWQK